MRNLLMRLTLLPVQVALSLGVVAAASYAVAPDSEPTHRLSNQATSVTQLAQATRETRNLNLPTGVYLYGSSAQPEQIGQTYMVFRVDQNRVVGAFYMPRSSFDCFHGDMKGNSLALNIVNSYDQQSHSYQVALEQQFPNTAASQASANAVIGLQGYHRISKISENDQRILGVCQAQF